MKQKLIFLNITLLLINSVLCSQEQEKHQYINDSLTMNTYINDELTVYFEDPIEIFKNPEVQNQSYFFQSGDVIRFNRVKPDPISDQYSHQKIIHVPEALDHTLTQELLVRTSNITSTEKKNNPLAENDLTLSKDDHLVYHPLSGIFSYEIYLSTLFVLPKKSQRKLKKEIQQYVIDHPPYQIAGSIKKNKIGDKKVLQWLLRAGKTRLDHYMVLGKQHNYLFVSSPYSSNGHIETVIAKLKFIGLKYIR